MTGTLKVKHKSRSPQKTLTDESKFERERQQRGNSCCRERLADDDGGAIAQPVGDEAARKLARGPPPMKTRVNANPAVVTARAFSDQQER